MYALTNKNYYNLEENKQRREELLRQEKKKEDLKVRKEKIKELDDVILFYFHLKNFLRRLERSYSKNKGNYNLYITLTHF